MTEDTTKHPQEGRGDGAPTDAGSTDSGASDRRPEKGESKPRKAKDKDKAKEKDKAPGAPSLGSVLRTRAAQVVWTAAVVCALFLAVGALLVALKANTGNALVRFVLDVADALDLEVFSRRNGVFKMTGSDAATKNALANWGLAAVAYLVVGRIVDRVVRP